LLAVFAPPVARAQQSPRWAAFTQTFDNTAAQDSVVGGSVVFVRQGRVVAHHEHGLADRAPGPVQPVDERTIFHYGSITKTLTAVAIMQLRDRGRLSLDDRITSYIPELRQVHDPFGSMDVITIRMLLSHSSGFQNPTWPYRRYVSWEPFEPVRWDQLVAMMPYQELLFAPGSRYGYSNPAFIYLARIIEQLSGDPYQSYIYKNIWVPLGMTRSYFAATPWILTDQRSNNYTLVADSGRPEHVVANGRDFDPGITIPNGGWNAPLADLVTWTAFLTGATHGDSATARLFNAVLTRSSLEEMWHAVVPVGGAAGESMGLSFFLRPLRGVTLVGHTGEQAGFRSFLYFNPRTSEAVIGVFNTTNDAHANESAARWQNLLAAAADLIAP
jgi:CubicO group peptidase (beta-lactamase class C family)